ncbi:acylneuraminate cytidylyltransferase [Galbitalea sp. SE-J8]|uniref:acylneuraminate cytidylyltransferase n=1 Tax=Galbitalea sp. SE-J8 TaxID=3054952 RepID=UPI00259D0CB7|nr:acylneuraminate cytidylyltransferase [Galbitalea sp. SE-J8]MDM4763366.1 acylneuraminate cytidylyltransferase [Galbitalea sp. SE-J8]
MAPRPAPGVVAVVPARGGSKGVPGKNLRRVAGVPLVVRAVRAARAAGLVDDVVVSTDDAAIAEAARAAGAIVVDRPAELSGDTASSEAALLHALGALPGEYGILAFLQATSPFIDPADLDAAIARVRDDAADSVLAAAPAHEFLWRESPDGAVGTNHDHARRLRRQDAEPQFRETGAFYVVRTDLFRAHEHRFVGRVALQVVPELTAIEIDTPDDLAVARAIAPLVSVETAIDVDAVITDFDGVHTDDRVTIDEHGREAVAAHRGDGLGIAALRGEGIPLLIVSAERNPVVSARAAKLRIDVRRSVDDKRAVVEAWIADAGLDPERVAYVGNDVNDLAAMRAVGWPIAVADAHPAVLAAARVVLEHSGGHGAVREVAERVLLGRAASVEAASVEAAATDAASVDAASVGAASAEAAATVDVPATVGTPATEEKSAWSPSVPTA